MTPTDFAKVQSDYNIQKTLDQDLNIFLKLEGDIKDVAHDHLKKYFSKKMNGKYLKVSQIRPETEDGLVVGVNLTFSSSLRPGKPEDLKEGFLSVSPGPFLKNFKKSFNGLDSEKAEIVAVDKGGNEQLKITITKKIEGGDEDVKKMKVKLVTPEVYFDFDGDHATTGVFLSGATIEIEGDETAKPRSVKYDVVNRKVIR